MSMDINRMSDADVLNYLMSSNYEENFTEEEYRHLLFKFKRFFRNSQLKLEQLNHLVDKVKQDTKDELLRKDVDFIKMKKSVEDLTKELENIKSRKLTLKERFKGAIYTK